MPNKAQFVELLAERLDGDKKKAQAALDAVIDTVYQSVSKGERVVLTGFGVFEKRERAARTARNPATGATVKVKKTSVPAFKAGAEFKAITSGAKKMAKSPVKRATAAARKAVAKATPTSTSRTAARKTTTTSTPAKKTTAAKSTPAKKTTATKKTTAAKKAPAKTTAARTTAARSTAAKKAPAKKTAAKRAPAKKAR